MLQHWTCEPKAEPALGCVPQSDTSELPQDRVAPSPVGAKVKALYSGSGEKVLRLWPPSLPASAPICATVSQLRNLLTYPRRS